MTTKSFYSTPDVDVDEFVSHGIPVRRVRIKTQQAAEQLGRECGQYITLHMGQLDMLTEFEDACDCLVEQFRPLLEPFFGKSLCICGIGNQDTEFDCLGPEAAKRIRPKFCEPFGFTSVFEKIAVICPGVNGHTNLSSDTIVAGIAESMNAACVLTIDSTACESIEKLCSTIELTDTGMKSTLGTANLRRASLGMPVVSIGMPTSIRADSICKEDGFHSDMFLSPIHVSSSIDIAAFIIACAITRIAYPKLDYEDCKQLITLFLLGFA